LGGFDSKFTSYANLSELNHQGVQFNTLRRRGKTMVEGIEALSRSVPWHQLPQSLSWLNWAGLKLKFK